MTWQPVEGTDIGPAVASYAAYLEAVYPTEYIERCDPSSRIGTEYNRNGDLALVPECGELMLQHIGEIAEWVDAGRPPLGE